MKITLKDLITAGVSWFPSSLKKVFYKSLGYQIGKNVRLGMFSIISCDKVKIGENVKIAPFVLIKTRALEIGDNSLLGAWTWVIGKKKFKMGKFSRFTSPFSYVNVSENVTIGDVVGVGSHTTIYSHGVFLPYTEGYPRKFAPVKIGNKVWIGSNSNILPGVNIGENCIIQTASVVTNSIPKDSFATGNPCRVIAPIERIKKKMDKKELTLRLKEIVDNFRERFKTKKIILMMDLKKIDINNFPKDTIILGLNIADKHLLKDFSWFDIKERKCSLKTNLAKTCKVFLNSYGEYFEEIK